ncbi:MAG: hypothetical protein PHT94_00830 [Candidatus Nanoarchaeia archaeon]|nr:hypothetical protein [Candidatus Nanoarchaeia archaeon]
MENINLVVIMIISLVLMLIVFTIIDLKKNNKELNEKIESLIHSKNFIKEDIQCLIISNNIIKDDITKINNQIRNLNTKIEQLLLDKDKFIKNNHVVNSRLDRIDSKVFKINEKISLFSDVNILDIIGNLDFKNREIEEQVKNLIFDVSLIKSSIPKAVEATLTELSKSLIEEFDNFNQTILNKVNNIMK